MTLTTPLDLQGIDCIHNFKIWVWQIKVSLEIRGKTNNIM